MNPQVFKDAIPEILTQLLGFLVVFFILKRFAFKPVLGIVDARRKKIEDEFSGIEQKKQSLEALEKEYRSKLQGIEAEARLKIQEAAGIGTQLARDIQERARIDAEKLLVRARAELDQDLAKARLGMRDQIVELSSLMTEKILRSTLDPKGHEKLIDQFLKDLEKVS